MANQLLLFKNIPYNKTRMTIAATQSGVVNYYYTEAAGSRYYYTFIGATAAPDLQAASYDGFISFTMSGAATHEFDISPLNEGETVMINTEVTALNIDASKGYLMDSFGGYRHNGTSISMIGSTITYDEKTDFSTVSARFFIIGSQSIGVRCVGQTSQVLDWNIHIQYKKGFHSVIFGPGGDPSQKPIYPAPPPID
jgi:hypothetical protein